MRIRRGVASLAGAPDLARRVKRQAHAINAQPTLRAGPTPTAAVLSLGNHQTCVWVTVDSACTYRAVNYADEAAVRCGAPCVSTSYRVGLGIRLVGPGIGLPRTELPALQGILGNASLKILVREGTPAPNANPYGRRG